MRLRFKEGQKVLVRYAPSLITKGTVDAYVGNVDIYEVYRVTTKNEEGQKYVCQFYDVDMIPLSL